ncbi:hypothetical protein AALO_G00049880 [Alosa alosa]|uniref:RNA-binding protein 38 n=1 Tax=Alosa alosa TaxID=278164 RepID=A0AAV6H730_9TELE|nr:RNA-binding protein 38 [Alosa alosa]KAG5281885.1 hypothetical protein AALO_G00049880 [Alosa alosa]
MLLHQFVKGTLETMHPTIKKDTTFTKIFVGGLPYHTTDASLRKYFETFGDIDEAVVITDRQTGKSRGYGFVTMMDRGAAERACKDPNPIIDGRKANVNLAYLGAKPRSPQTGLSIGVQQIHPTLLQRQYGLAQQYVYPQAFVQPSLVLPTQVTSTVGSPYLDYNTAYAQYASAAFEQYPYAASPGFLSYTYPTTTALGPSAAATPNHLPPPLSAGSNPAAAAFLQYPAQPLHSDRLQ